ncbi:HlyD family secretion protein [Saprospira grandis]|uniref:HlyD family secretion protein n=1 Tax=Saprospira grandis TaxID=1008 RepID=UPI0022DE0707|nr:biotin/lipoyl-binding protein [Saprospira grandis]WBM75424.1 HlyD family secretion protein [Saprospira grandis]
MLNISPSDSLPIQRIKQYPAFKKVSTPKSRRWLLYTLLSLFILLFSMAFLPWTQNIRAKGKVTSLRPEDRPQSVYPIIPGRIEQWYVQEGDTVHAGDTLVRLSEIKVAYMDPELVQRTDEQLVAKSSSVVSYQQKAEALAQRIRLLRESRGFKLEQAENKLKQAKFKIASDSAKLEAAKMAQNIAEKQFFRTDTLYQKGLKSLTELEAKRNKMQETEAKLNAAENKLELSKNEYLNAKIALNSIRADYGDKLAKAESDRLSALTAGFDSQEKVAKLKNTKANYQNRQQFYYILAPQDGFVSKIYKKGIGETLKETEQLLAVAPLSPPPAVEIYVRPMDYPLLQKGETVIFTFDGWPAFVFAGWPNQSVGTFKGKVYAVDNAVSDNSMFRALVIPDPYAAKDWPNGLRVGAAAEARILLKDVYLGYEVWRQLNGFPPDYYEINYEKVKMKAPVNQLKK